MPCSSLVYLYWLQSILNRSGPASSRGLNVYGLATLEEGNSLSKTPSRYVQLTPCGDLSEWRARFGFDRAIFASRDRRRLRLLFARFAEESGNMDWVLWGSAVLALPGLAGILLLALRCIWSERPARGSAFALLAPAVSMVFFVFSAQRVLGLANLLYSKTFDLYLFLADGSFGFQPSFFLSRAMVRSALLGIAVKLTYVSLPFVMALIYAMRIPKNTERPAWDMISIFLLAGLAGSLLYNILPATGPLYAFHGYFPWQSLPYESLKRLRLEPISLPRDIPRNAIPSLHVAWAILLWWNSRRLSLPIRIFTGAYLVLTILSTLATGEHYLVDIIAAIPFALCVQAIVSPENPSVK